MIRHLELRQPDRAILRLGAHVRLARHVDDEAHVPVSVAVRGRPFGPQRAAVGGDPDLAGQLSCRFLRARDRLLRLEVEISQECEDDQGRPARCPSARSTGRQCSSPAPQFLWWLRHFSSPVSGNLSLNFSFNSFFVSGGLT